MATIAENLQKLITAKNNIIDALKDKGIEMPDNANLSSVSSLITSSSIAPQTVAKPSVWETSADEWQILSDSNWNCLIHRRASPHGIFPLIRDFLVAKLKQNRFI